MGLKLVLFVLASFLLVTARASYNDEELLLEAPTQSPMKAPAPAEVPASTPILLPTPPVEAPTPILPAKPPVLPAPHIKVSSPTKPTMRLECIPLCLRRCILQMRCYTACMKCCDRCKCVPPGVFGNRDKCGNCYINMTTPSGWPMCP